MCRGDGCDVLLHFPCAAISGAFQDSSNQTTVCSSHIDSLYASGMFHLLNTLIRLRTKRLVVAY